MLKKLFWSLILLWVLFVLSVFKAPELATSIANLAGFPNLPEKIQSFKWTYDNVLTDIPTQEELTNQYNSTLSWALEFKENIVNWVNTTKDKVDSLRETLSWAEQKIEDLKETYNDAKDFIDTTAEKIEETKKIIEDTTAVINNVKNITETITGDTVE